MLKFIAEAIKAEKNKLAFQNILCWSLSIMHSEKNIMICISKHLMLKFIFAFIQILLYTVLISKHLMLKFIRFTMYIAAILTFISKHLMLKFIFSSGMLPDTVVWFQNILCWSLSHIFSLLLSPFIYFPLHFSWFLSFLPSISPYSFSYPISHKFPDFTILSQHFSFFRLVNISTTHNQAWGARQMSSQLKMRDHKVGRSKTRLCMTKMGIDPIYPKIIIKHTITNLFFIFKA